MSKQVPYTDYERGVADERARIQAEIKALHECAATCEGAWMELREYIEQGETNE